MTGQIFAPNNGLEQNHSESEAIRPKSDTPLQHVEDTLREAKDRLDAMLNALPDLFFEIDRKGKIFDYRAPRPELLYATPEQFLGKTIWEVLPEDTCYVISRAIAKAAEYGHVDGETYSLETPGGARWFEISIAAKGDLHSPDLHFIALVRDITKHKQVEQQLRASLAEKELLLKEVHHRVKNNLQVIVSLLNLQADFIEDPTALEAFREAQNRVISIAFVHERLYHSPDLARVDFTDYIHTLVDRLFKSYGVDDGNIQLITDIRDIRLNINSAIPCGLMVNELVSNCLKHAFPDGRSGNIQVKMLQDENQISLEVSDNGVGLPQEFDVKNSGSLGLQLVEILTEQVQGKLVIDRSQGTSFQITFQAKRS